ncbi:hypothetical protein [Oceanidesulfovibrio marinus]|uniref:Uncharacterized protein n=1 Tax=Oceanidesulfovibrio marinus TaxID=370038 RepID=A0ABX6NEN4_9BACT|nr:hypothetical protein [Oceanidesulfovibrio marinus]QJT08604.1 hypothetical protein E8L03_06560 [Oceanidesulfovibrio marinus]
MNAILAKDEVEILLHGLPGACGGQPEFCDTRGHDLSELFNNVKEKELWTGNLLSARRKGESRLYYRVVHVDHGLFTRVTVRRIWVHPFDVIQLMAIAGLCSYICNKLVPFFMG